MYSKAILVGAATALMSICASGAQAQLLNGDLSSPGTSFTFVSLGYAGAHPVPSTYVTDWTGSEVNYESAGYIAPYAPGDYSIDLNGNKPGQFSQTFATIAGEKYTVTFGLSGTQGSGANFVPMKEISVLATGGPTTDFFFNSTGMHGRLVRAGRAPANNTWVTDTYQFTASGNSTTLTFQGISPGISGGQIADVRLATNGVPEPGAWGLMLVGLVGVGYSLRRKAVGRGLVRT